MFSFLCNIKIPECILKWCVQFEKKVKQIELFSTSLLHFQAVSPPAMCTSDAYFILVYGDMYCFVTWSLLKWMDVVTTEKNFS